MIHRLCIATFALLCASCAPGAGLALRPDGPSRPAPALLFPEAPEAPAEWALHGPFLDAVAPTPHPSASAWEQVFLSELAAARPGVEVSGNLWCAGRELNHYLLETGAEPPADLAPFAAARCGGAYRWVESAAVSGAREDAASDAGLIEATREEVRALIARFAHADAIALSFDASGPRWAVRVTAAGRGASLDRFGVASAYGGAFVIEGEASGPTEAIFGRINRGRFGVRPCEPDKTVPPPRFSLRCEGDPKDALAWVEISARSPGRVLGRRVALALVSPSGSPSNVFRRERFDRPAPPEPDAASAFTALVNQIRRSAGMSKLQLDAVQSATAARIAPHYFGAAMGEDPEKVTDLIALGMMAGWDVTGGTIQYGTFASKRAGKRDLGELASAMVLYPSGRDALLDPKATRVAVGEADDRNAVALVVSAYAMLDRKSPEEEAAQVVTTINEARAARGLDAATWLSAPPGAAEEAVRIVEEGGDPRDGTRRLVDAATEQTGAAMKGWTLHTWSLDRLDLPTEVLMTPKLALLVAVAAHRRPEDPWGRFVVMVVLPERKAEKPTLRVELPRPPAPALPEDAQARAGHPERSR